MKKNKKRNLKTSKYSIRKRNKRKKANVKNNSKIKCQKDTPYLKRLNFFSTESYNDSFEIVTSNGTIRSYPPINQSNNPTILSDTTKLMPIPYASRQEFSKGESKGGSKGGSPHPMLLITQDKNNADLISLFSYMSKAGLLVIEGKDKIAALNGLVIECREILFK